LLGVGEYFRWEEFAGLWTEIVGKELECKEMGVGEWDMLVPGGFGKEFAESKAFSGEFGWGAGDEGRMLMPKDLDANVKLTTLREYIQQEDWNSVLSL